MRWCSTVLHSARCFPVVLSNTLSKHLLNYLGYRDELCLDVRISARERSELNVLDPEH